MYGISKAGKYRTRAAKRLQIQHPNESCMSKRALSDESDQSDTGDSFNQPDSDRKQKRLQKKHKKQQLNNVLAGRGTRADFIDVYGSDARVELQHKFHEISKKDQRLSAWDFQSLVLWCLADATLQPRWCFVKCKPLIHKILVVCIDGLSPSTFQLVPSLSQHELASSNQSDWPLALPVDSAAERTTGHDVCCAAVPSLKEFSPALFQVHGSLYASSTVASGLLSVKASHLVDKQTKKEKKAEAGNTAPASESASPICYFETAQSFVLSELELANSKFPMCDEHGLVPSGFTIASSSAAIQPRLLAVDCEMVRTALGLELARITLVDESMSVVYDTLVRPENEILDYCTQWSGISETTLVGVTTKLSDVHTALNSIISPSCILVGHSLENDFQAMRLVHSRVLDTSIMYPHPRGPPYRSSLKYLAKKYLKIDIQAAEAGHDSAEDACAAMRLALLKVRSGPQFGLNGDECPDTESLLTVLSRHRRATSVIGSPELLKALAPPSSSAIPSTGDDDALRRAKTELTNRNDLVWVNLGDWWQSVQSLINPLLPAFEVGNALVMPAVSTAALDTYRAACTLLNQRLIDLQQSCERNTVMLVVSGQTAQSVVRRAMSIKLDCARQQEVVPEVPEVDTSSAVPATNKWSEAHESALQSATKAISLGMLWTRVM